MDAIRRAMKKSGKTGGHKKLPEGWNENKEAVSDGITFYLKYIGSTLVEETDDGESYGDGMGSKAVQNIITMAKAAGKKLKKVALTASPAGIRVVDMITKEVLEEITIYRISFCSADKVHDKVFAFTARNTVNETVECHAFLCAKRKLAQAVTLTVSKAFELAKDQEEWSGGKSAKTSFNEQSKQNNSRNSDSCNDQSLSRPDVISPNTDTTVPIPRLRSPQSSKSHSDTSLMSEESREKSDTWQEFEDDLDDDFSRLAENRSREKPSFSSSLLQDNLDEGVSQYFDSNRCLEEFSRTKSVEDLLCL